MEVNIESKIYIESGITYDGKVIFIQLITEQSSPYDNLWRNMYYQKHLQHTDNGQTHFHFYDELGNQLFSFNIDGSIHDGKAPTKLLPRKLLQAMRETLHINTDNIESKYIKS